MPTEAPIVAGGYLTGKKLIYPLCLVISLFFLWGFSYGLLDVRIIAHLTRLMCRY